ncbi:hypothetical protein IWZ00DRAFT_7608 [Phyllosticta capitalensis]
MKAFAVAALAAVAIAAPNPDKTVYQTDEVTITSCGPEVTNCPARSHSATPTPEVTPSASSPAEATSSSVAGGSAPPAVGTPVAGSPSGSAPVETPGVSYTHSTIYSTVLSTITTGSSSGGVVTQTVAISTTYCPVEATQTGVQGGSAPTPSAPAPSSGVPALGTPGVGGGSSSCAPIYSTKTVYVTPGVPVGTPSAGNPYGTPG